MTFGAVNEWTTQAGYARLGALSGHPVLRDLLRRIMRQEGRHIDYYRSRAAELLEGSRAQRTTRLALRHLWQPVGAKVMPEPETAHLVRTLFGGPDGRAMAERVDRRIDQLPGLSGLGLVTGALDRQLRAA
jgi:Mn-containing catalase